MSEEKIPVRVDWTPFELLTEFELGVIYHLLRGVPIAGSMVEAQKAQQWFQDYCKWYEERKV